MVICGRMLCNYFKQMVKVLEGDELIGKRQCKLVQFFDLVIQDVSCSFMLVFICGRRWKNVVVDLEEIQFVLIFSVNGNVVLDDENGG